MIRVWCVSKGFEKELIKRGWKEGKFNGRRCLMKELGSWLWICLPSDQEVKLVSFPIEDSSRVHSEGMRKLIEELKEVSEVMDFSLSARMEYGS